MSYVKKIIRRALIVLPAVLLQIIWLMLLIRFLAPWAVLISLVLSVLAFFFVLYLITKQGESSYKVLWLLLILPFPIPGTLLYLLFGNKRPTRPLQRQLRRHSIPPESGNSEALYSELEQTVPRMAQSFRVLQNTTGFSLRRNTDASYYPLGDALYPAMLEALEGAKSSICVEYFIVEPGEMWDGMVAIMERKAAEGVAVRVLYDDLGSIATYSISNVKELWRKGIQCVPFNPMLFVKGTLNYRDHRKMLIVDDKLAFSGGVNLADEYINKKKPYGHWKDIGFRLTGPAVANYSRMFAEFWNAFAASPIAPALFSPQQTEDTDKPGDGYVLSYYDSPLRNEDASNDLYIDLLSQAEKSAWFITPYLMPGEALLDAFLRAARRGVDVRIIMPGIPDKKLIYRMSRSFYPPLLQAGVKIYEYIPGFVHAKASVIDSTTATIGTVNLDYRSLFLHFENNSLFYRAKIVDEIRDDFLATQALCRQVKEKDYGKLSLLRWTLDGILRIFAPLC